MEKVILSALPPNRAKFLKGLTDFSIIIENETPKKPWEKPTITEKPIPPAPKTDK